jgi:hypothetical protein
MFLTELVMTLWGGTSSRLHPRAAADVSWVNSKAAASGPAGAPVLVVVMITQRLRVVWSWSTPH